MLYCYVSSCCSVHILSQLSDVNLMYVALHCILSNQRLVCDTKCCPALIMGPPSPAAGRSVNLVYRG